MKTMTTIYFKDKELLNKINENAEKQGVSSNKYIVSILEEQVKSI